MAFVTRCPECAGKLVLDERPARGVAVECSQCGNVFVPPPPKPRVRDEDDEPTPVKRPAARRPAADRPDRPGKAATATAPKIHRTVRKKPINPVLLLAIVGSGFGLYALLYFAVEAYLGKAGRATELMAFVPEGTNHLRGVNLAGTIAYPGYQSQIDRHVTPDVRAAAEQLAQASGQDPAKFLDYFMVARQRGGRESVLYLMRSDKKLKADAVGAALKEAGATDAKAGSGQGYHFGAKGAGLLKNATLYIASPYVIVIAPDGPNAQQLLTESAAGQGGGADVNFLKHYWELDTAQVCSRGAVWLIVRQQGALENYVETNIDKLKSDSALKEVHAKGSKAKAFGSWATPGGGGVIIGAALELESSDEASALRKYMQNGPLGNADESEPTNELKQSGLSFVSDKKVFGEFMQYCEFKNSGNCAYLRSKIGNPEAIPRVMEVFAAPTMGLGQNSGGGGFGGGGEGGGGRGGPPRPGLPGGIAMPGG